MTTSAVRVVMSVTYVISQPSSSAASGVRGTNTASMPNRPGP